MTEQKVSVARIVLALVGIFVMLVGFGTCRHSGKMNHLNDQTAAEALRSLPHMFGVENLPGSVRDLECEGVDISCTRIARATCSFELDPKDFDTLFDHDVFREKARRDRLSQNLEGYIGPDFEVVREFRNGNEEDMWDLWIFTNRERDRVALNVVKDMHFDCN